MKKLFLIFLLISSIASAQNLEELFSSANTLYKEGKYKEAIELYRKIETKNLVSSELYYNLGNCYYKLNKVGPTIYNYEKALQLNPLNEDARNNLVFAKRLSFDRIEELPKSVFQKFNENYLQKLTYNQWGNISIILSILGAILFLLYYFTNISSRKRIFFIISVLSFLFLIAVLSIAYNQYNLVQNTKEAIIFSEEAIVKNEPINSANEAFVLHEGTKVIVLDNVDDWKKIRLSDGKVGWLLAKDLKEL